MRDSGLYPPGHFYSPIPSLEEVRARDAEIFGAAPDEIAGIDLNLQGQLELLEALMPYYAELPFTADEQEGLRYRFDNGFYSYSDAIFLYTMIRHFRPRRVIEVGSGYSSCVTLDTNELFFANRIHCTFIDPDFRPLRALLKPGDQARIRCLERKVQEVDLSTFDALTENDVLFVDSSHVSKIDSDLNHILFQILPRLRSGVLVHFHDVYYPFEYPRFVVYQGIAWNEAYLLRAFLQYNDAFRIQLFNTFLEHFHPERVYGAMPLCQQNPGGSLWLRRM